MSDHRWQRIEEIFQRAAALAPEARSAFLDQACGADESLCREVESLLAHESGDGGTFAGAPKTIAHYRILGKLGEGGMGAVYRATDTKLGREVAIKVLPRSFADDLDRMARFAREAKVLASLNHPHIAQIYGLEEGALIMELVPGETLKGPLPLAAALDYARQIAEGLEAAHEKGIVHRDLKPGNIVVTPEGAVKLLDFGLAAIAQTAGDPLNSPTVTMQTTPGTILGTAAYMSPEQASGKPVDKRADIWSFGVVLYEILTGHRLFEGENVSETLASVMKDEPDLSRVPARVRRLLESCLEKDPRKRLRDIGDAWRLLNESPVAASAPRHVAQWISWALASVLAIAAAIGWMRTGSAAKAQPSVTLSIVPPPGLKLTDRTNSVPSISPDGSAVLYSVGPPGYYVRRLDSLEIEFVAGSEVATNPAFWSSDATSVVYPAAGVGHWRKVRMPDGAPQAIASLMRPSRGGDWSDAGTILFSEVGLRSMPSTGGEAKPVKLPDAFAEGSLDFPEFLPGSEDFLFLFRASDPDADCVYLATLRDGSGLDPVPLLKNSTPAHFTPAGGGRILFVRSDNLYSQKMNRRTRRLEGEPERVVRGVSSTEAANFSVARDGTLAWRPGVAANAQVTEFDREGHVRNTAGPKGPVESLRLSPDEKQLLVAVDRSTWLVDLGKTGRTELPKGVQWIGWFAGGSKLMGVRRGELLKMSAGGSGELQEFGRVAASSFRGSSDVSLDGRQIVGLIAGDLSSFQLGETTEEIKPRVVVKNATGVYGPHFSPDGRWVVYEIRDPSVGGLYVQPFPGPGPRQQIAPVGGRAVWRGDGKEILYVSDDAVMSVPVAGGGKPAFGAPRKLFSGLRISGYAVASDTPLAVSRDGSRIFWLQQVEQPESNVIYVKTGAVK